jgi:hypothetical protein
MSFAWRIWRATLILGLVALIAARLPSLLSLLQESLPPRHGLRPWVISTLADPTRWQLTLAVCGLTGALMSLRINAPAKRRANASDPLGMPLLTWSSGDAWSIRDALEGTLVLGATGSGKTSASGRTIALSMLRAGWGGLVLTAKPGELAVWEGYCREAGRSDDVIVIDASCKLRFNPLAFESQQSIMGAGLTLNLVHLLTTILEAAAPPEDQGGGRSDEAYWKNAMRQLLRNCVDLLTLGGETISVPHLYQLVISAPQSLEQVESDRWRGTSYCFACLSQAEDRAKSPRDAADFELVANYFAQEFPQLSEKTRSIIVSMFTATIDVLNRGLLRDLLCTTTNITPQEIEKGKIIIVNLPVKEYGVVGRTAQVIFKYAFQRAIERRDVNLSPLPAFLWADEFQNFVTEYDYQFLATCRSARVASVLLTQNLSGLEAALGGQQKGEAAARALVGQLNTKVIHANGCPHTNSWVADLLGKGLMCLMSSNQSRQQEVSVGALLGTQQPAQLSSGFSEHMDYLVQPSEFSRLRTGGPVNDGLVDAYVFQNGRRLQSTGLPFARIVFQQSRA